VIELAHASRHLVVAIKPSGLLTTGEGDSLTRRLQEQLGVKLHASSRLDAEVSGLVTYARSKRGNAALGEARQRGEYQREYLGLCAAEPDPAAGIWDAPIAIDPRDRRLRLALGEGERGEGERAAQTRFSVRASCADGAALRLEPLTGRTHQLRVHAARAGVPLLGDHRYGGPKRVVLGNGRVVRAARVMLHCLRVRVPDAEGGWLSLVSEPPADLSRLWVSLGGVAAELTARRETR